MHTTNNHNYISTYIFVRQLFTCTAICNQIWEKFRLTDPISRSIKITRRDSKKIENFRDEKGIVVLSVLKVSRLTIIPNRFWVMINWMWELWTFLQIQSHSYSIVAIYEYGMSLQIELHIFMGGFFEAVQQHRNISQYVAVKSVML